MGFYTRLDFCEGLPQVCAEAVLMGRPVVTSRISNAIEVLGDAVSVAEPEVVESYVARIAELANDAELYWRRIAACGGASICFTDASQGLAVALDRALRKGNPKD
jgi:glycogen synthase